jgi:hypothetical protein
VAGDKIVEDTAAGTHTVYQQKTGLSAGAVYTLSVFAKAAERTRIWLGEGNNTTGSAIFDLSAGTVVQVTGNGSPSATITAVGNGWYRCTLTLTLVGTIHNSQMGLVQSGTTINYVGNGFDGVFVWGAQLEAGAFATSYIATVATTQTRNADQALMTGTNLSSWYNTSEGTLYGDYFTNDTTNAQPFCCEASTASRNQILYMIKNSVGQARAGLSGSPGGNFDFTTLGAVAVGQQVKMSLAYKTNDSAGVKDGGTVSTSSLNGVITPDRFGIGTTGSATSNFLNGCLRKLAYYPVRLTNAQILNLTRT